MQQDSASRTYSIGIANPCICIPFVVLCTTIAIILLFIVSLLCVTLTNRTIYLAMFTFANMSEFNKLVACATAQYYRAIDENYYTELRSFPWNANYEEMVLPVESEHNYQYKKEYVD